MALDINLSRRAANGLRYVASFLGVLGFLSFVMWYGLCFWTLCAVGGAAAVIFVYCCGYYADEWGGPGL